MTFASRSPQKAATELNAVLTVGGGQRTGRTFTLNGTTRTPWVPEAVPAPAGKRLECAGSANAERLTDGPACR